MPESKQMHALSGDVKFTESGEFSSDPSNSLVFLFPRDVPEIFNTAQATFS